MGPFTNTAGSTMHILTLLLSSLPVIYGVPLIEGLDTGSGLDDEDDIKDDPLVTSTVTDKSLASSEPTTLSDLTSTLPVTSTVPLDSVETSTLEPTDKGSWLDAYYKWVESFTSLKRPAILGITIGIIVAVLAIIGLSIFRHSV